jgi:hypothetical protein
MRKVKATLVFAGLLTAFSVVARPARPADIGAAIGGNWGAWGALAGGIIGGIAGGLAGSAILPGPGTVVGEMTGSDLGIIVGGA